MMILNPADENRRQNMTLRLSSDEGMRWPVLKVLHTGSSAYPDLTRLRSDEIGGLYEAVESSAYQGIVFQIVP